MIGPYHYAVLTLFGAFALVELLIAARPLPAVARWRAQGVAFLFLSLFLGTLLPTLWDAWLGQYRLLPADRLPLWAQVVGGFLLLELGIYWWHRTMHGTPVLWRWFHQMHHSAERIDVWGTFFAHPLDTFGWSLLGSLFLVLGFGVSVDAAIIINLLATFYTLVGHLNVGTPTWLGYIVARPESHAAHHERGVHGRNYGDVPLFDILFGTFHNPASFPAKAGFYEGGSGKLAAMLMGRPIA